MPQALIDPQACFGTVGMPVEGLLLHAQAQPIHFPDMSSCFVEKRGVGNQGWQWPCFVGTTAAKVLRRGHLTQGWVGQPACSTTELYLHGGLMSAKRINILQ